MSLSFSHPFSSYTQRSLRLLADETISLPDIEIRGYGELGCTRRMVSSRF